MERSFRNRKLRRCYNYVIEPSALQGVGRARHIFADAASRAPIVFLLCHHPVSIPGLERKRSRLLFNEAGDDWAIESFSARLLSGERVDVLGEIAKHFNLYKPDDVTPTDDAYDLTNRVIARIEQVHDVKFDNRRGPRGYELHKKTGVKFS